MPYPLSKLDQVALFPFPPNWAKPLAETLEWKTDVLRAHDGSEQRRSLRVLPRMGLEYDFMIKGDDARLFESLMWGRQARMFAVPMWMDMSSLTASASIGASTIALNTTDLGFANEGVVCIYRSPTVFEIALANIVSAGQITLQVPLAKAWLAGDRVYPVLIGKPPSSLPTQRHSGQVLSGRASFVSSPDLNSFPVPNAVAPVIYDGLEVVTVQPNWKRAIGNTWAHEFETQDTGVGAVRWLQTEVAGRITRPYAWLLKSRADISAFRSFVWRMRGQSKTCWIPSWHDDFIVVTTTGVNGSTLTVKGTHFATHVGVDAARDRIVITLTDGSTLYRKITGISTSGGNTVLQLSTTFAQDIGPGNVQSINLLLHSRLLGDKVELPWQTDSVSDPQLVFTTVPL